MARRHRNPVGPERLSERRHGDRRAPAPRPRRSLRIRLVVVLALAAIAVSMLADDAFAARDEVGAHVAQRELVRLSALRLQAMRVTELAHVELFEATAAAETADAARLQDVLDTWQADLVALGGQVPGDSVSAVVRSTAAQLRGVLDVDVDPLGPGDPLLSAITRLTPTRNRLVESAGASASDGADGVADRTIAQLYALGFAADLTLSASATRADVPPAWQAFGTAVATFGATGGVGALASGPLAGRADGAATADRLSDLVAPLVDQLGDRAPTAEYLATLTWAPAHVGAGGADEAPPMPVADFVDETTRLVRDVTKAGDAAASDRVAAINEAESSAHAAESIVLVAMAAVVAAALLLVAMLFAAARRVQREREQEARIDPLTGLMNRAGFTAAVGRLESTTSTWLVLIDLDRFRPVNDSFGHAIGDAVLVAVADEIDAATALFDGVVARLGGDEFAVAVADTAAHDIDLAVARIIEHLEVIAVGGRRIELGCSVGVVHGAPGVGLDQLLVEADLAMYRAKRSGRGRSVHFDDASRVALARFRDGTIGASVEVGVRLQRSLADRSIVGAMVFPQIAGPGGEIVEGADLRLIAEFSGRRFGLLDATLEGIAHSGRPIPPAGLRLWFEASAPDVVAFGGVEALWQRLSKVGLSGALLGVELLDAGSQDPESLAVAVGALRDHGVHVAVAGTGPGAVGLAGLARLSIDRLVIDPTVVEAIRGGDAEVARAVGAVATMGANLGTEIIAVGVSSLDVAQLLVEAGVDVAQVAMSERWAPAAPPRRNAPVVADNAAT